MRGSRVCAGGIAGVVAIDGTGRVCAQVSTDKPQPIPIWQRESQGRACCRNAYRITATPARHWGARMFKDTHRGFGGYVTRVGERADDLSLGRHGLFWRVRGDRAAIAAGDCAAADWRLFSRQLSRGAYEPGGGAAGFRGFEGGRHDSDALRDISLGREPMDEPLQRLLRAAERAGVDECVVALAEGESWMEQNADAGTGISSARSSIRAKANAI